MNFKDSNSLASVRKVINEANEALNNKSRTIADSAIPEALAGALGAGAGGVASFAALYFGGSVVGLSAAGITSGLAAAGAVVFWKKKNCNKCIDSEEDELMDATGDDAFSEVAEVAEDIKEAAKEEAAKVEAKAEEVKEEAKAEVKEEKN